MFNARDLLGQVLQTGMTGSATSRMRHAMGPEGLGRADNPLAQLFGQGGSGGGLSGVLGGLGGFGGTAEGLLGDAGRAVKGGNPLALGGLAALAGAVLGGGGGAMRGALGGGALALLGGIAMSALRNRNQGGAAPDAEQLAKEAPLGLREPQGPAEDAELERRARLILRAMIGAAKADGEIDGSEVQRIFGRLKEQGADAEASAFVVEEMQKPLDLNGLVREVESPEVAVEVYAASLLAIAVDTPAERAYLDRLAQNLGLDRTVVQRVHDALGVAGPARDMPGATGRAVER